MTILASGPAVQSVEVPPGSLRQGDQRADRWSTSRCSPTVSMTQNRSTISIPAATDACPSVVTTPYFDWGHDRPPPHQYHESIIYEAHVEAS